MKLQVEKGLRLDGDSETGIRDMVEVWRGAGTVIYNIMSDSMAHMEEC